MRLPTAAQVGAVLEAADLASRPFVALCAFVRSGSARPPPSRSGTSTSCDAPSWSRDRCSAPAASRSGRPRTAASGRCSSRPASSTSWPRTWPVTAPDGSWPGRPTPARPPALLRLGTHRLRLRRRHRPASPRARQRDHDAQHLQPSLAHRGGPHPARRRAPLRRELRTGYGLRHVHAPLTRENAFVHTLKRNSTTSPSAMT